ncbi:MAG: molybdopterin-dependent oxidoreductase [Actinomycetota bacterium]|jgi:carbon-monoxide dehydrogenase large subunit|nr:molybdopterin-dependent oxidoreductase [Rubrobacter sp.]MDQ3506646.1 molybdopterin-dependent oxidoreductase [Actinomycetota bacterium]
MTEQAQKYVGGGVPRKEDPALVTGKATWTDNIKLPGMLHFALLRSPMAHAKITNIDASEALAMPGVQAVYTAEDINNDMAAGLPCAWLVTEDMKSPVHQPLAKDEVKHLGDAVAVVVADDRYVAKDALEYIDVDYEELPVVTKMEDALKSDSPLVHEEFGTNECYTWPLATGDVDEAFKNAPVIVKERYIQQRLLPTAIECRAVVANPDPVNGGFTVYTATQIPHILKSVLAGICGVPEQKMRVVAPDVGGGFGSKLNIYAEEALAVVLARKLGVPVKWVEERSENYLATTHGRDQIQDLEIAATSEGKILGLKVKLLADMGAYLQIFTPGIPTFGGFMFPGVYDFENYSFECKGVFTNKTPTDAYRGAGRPEAAYGIERIMDSLAREVGVAPEEIRRRNFYEPFDEPTETPAGIQYDSFNLQGALDKVLELADYEGLRAEQKRRRDDNDPVQLGIGFSTYTEICGLAPSQVLAAVGLGGAGWEAATVRMLASGTVEVVTGTTPHGQGHVTSWSQIAADVLGVTPDDVEVLHGDTAISPLGRDTYGSRSLTVGGVAVHLAAGKVVEKAKKIAAHMLEAAEDDIEFENGTFSVAGSPDQNVSMATVAGEAFLGINLPEGMEPNLTEDSSFDPPNFTYPFGAHICVTEVDTETGFVKVRDYFAVDDCGPIINPIIADGQIHGGIAQGLAQAIYEEAIYDEDGNLVTGSMLDYLIPGAPEIPHFTLDRTITPSPSNPLGVKGIGEAGTIGSPPAAVNSVIDALSTHGVTHIDMPTSPMKVWTAIQNAKGERAGTRDADRSGRPAQATDNVDEKGSESL